jgi:hypothetical protein
MKIKTQKYFQFKLTYSQESAKTQPPTKDIKIIFYAYEKIRVNTRRSMSINKACSRKATAVKLQPCLLEEEPIGVKTIFRGIWIKLINVKATAKNILQ